MDVSAMCTNPMTIDGVTLACHKCKQCRLHRQTDFVGRCIAESKNAKFTFCVTLTYGQDDAIDAELKNPRAVFLYYEDVQKYLKLMRQYTPFRYFCAGEYGSKKGRAHWHLIMFFERAVPPNLRLNQRYVHEGPHGRKLWEHGFSFWEEATTASIGYVCKYLLKDDGPDGQAHFALSKKPPLGWRYFEQRAEQYVQAGLSPQDVYYSFGEVIHETSGTPWVYKMPASCARLFLAHFVKTWLQVYGEDTWPYSELVDKFLDEEHRLNSIHSLAALPPDAKEAEFDRLLSRLELERIGKWQNAGAINPRKPHWEEARGIIQTHHARPR